MANEKKFHVGIKVLIENPDGQVLLMKTMAWKPNPAHWDIPGGRIQEGQTVDDTMAREVEEETGVTDITNPQFFTAVISNIEIPLKDGEVVGLVLMIYKATIPSDSHIQLSEEHTDYEWVSKVEAAERLSFKYPKEFTEKLRADASDRQ